MVIYKISVDTNVRNNNSETRDKIKLLAYLVYGELLDYEDETDKDILFKNEIIFNELYDGFRDRINKYEFEHNDYYNGDYEPFMIDDNTFGFTLYENSIDDKNLMIVINEVKNIIQLDCKLTIDKINVLDSEERINVIHNFYSNDNVHENSKKLQRKKSHF